MESAFASSEDRLDPPCLHRLCEELASAGDQLSSALVRARDLGCVEAAFSAFLGNPSIAVVRTLNGANAARPRAVLRGSLRQLYACARTWQHAREKPYGCPGDFSIPWTEQGMPGRQLRRERQPGRPKQPVVNVSASTFGGFGTVSCAWNPGRIPG